MVLENFVTLVPGVPKTMHFTAGEIVNKVITDPALLRAKTIKALHLEVDREDGVPVSKSFSVTSEKLAQSLAPYLGPGRLPLYDFTITLSGSGYTRSYSLEARPARS